MTPEIEELKQQQTTIKNKPKLFKVKFPYLLKKKRNWFWGLLKFGRKVPIDPHELQKDEPLLLYMTNDFSIIPYRNVKPGFLDTKNKKIINKIDTVKIHKLDYAGVPIKCYIHHENELTSYPNDPEYSSKQVHDIMLGIKSNDASLNEAHWLWNLDRKQIMNMLVLVGGFIGIIFAAIYAWKIFDLGTVFSNMGGGGGGGLFSFGGEKAAEAAEPITEAVTNATEQGLNITYGR